MSELKWIKVVTNIFEDEKIILIGSMAHGDSLLVLWFRLLCLAGKLNQNGKFCINENVFFSEKMFSDFFKKPKKFIKNSFEIFINFGLLEKENGCFFVKNWEKHQSAVDRKEYMKTYMREKRQGELKPENVNINKVNKKVNNVNCVSTTRIKNKEYKNIDSKKESNKERKTDLPTDEQKLNKIGGIGKNVVLLSDEQCNSLLSIIGLDGFDEYVERLADYIITRDAKIKSHYDTILKWYNEDTKIRG